MPVWWLTFRFDAEHQLTLVNVIGQLVGGRMVAMGTDGAVQLQSVSVESAQWSKGRDETRYDQQLNLPKTGNLNGN